MGKQVPSVFKAEPEYQKYTVEKFPAKTAAAEQAVFQWTQHLGQKDVSMLRLPLAQSRSQGLRHCPTSLVSTQLRKQAHIGRNRSDNLFACTFILEFDLDSDVSLLIVCLPPFYAPLLSLTFSKLQLICLVLDGLWLSVALKFHSKEH